MTCGGRRGVRRGPRGEGRAHGPRTDWCARDRHWRLARDRTGMRAGAGGGGRVGGARRAVGGRSGDGVGRGGTAPPSPSSRTPPTTRPCGRWSRAWSTSGAGWTCSSTRPPGRRAALRTPRSPSSPTTPWPREFDTKVMGYLRCARAVAPSMIAQGAGRIVNISGLNARRTGSIAGTHPQRRGRRAHREPRRRARPARHQRDLRAPGDDRDRTDPADARRPGRGRGA